MVLELHRSEQFEPDPNLVRCAQNLAATQIAITQQILWLTRLIESNEEPLLLNAQPHLPGTSIPLVASQTHLRAVPPVENQILIALPSIPGAMFEPASPQSTQPLRRAAQLYAAPKTELARLGPPSAGAVEEPSARINSKVLPNRLTMIAGLLLLIVSLWCLILNPREPTTAHLNDNHTPASAHETPSDAETQPKIQTRLSDTAATTSRQAPGRHETAPALSSDFTTAPLSQPTIVVMPPPKQQESLKEPPPNMADEPEDQAQPDTGNVVVRNSTPDVENVEPPARNREKVATVAEAPLPATKAPAETTTGFKTTVKPSPAPVQKFAPVILVLRDAKAALQIYQDLQKRHALVLGNKTAELRNFTGSDQTPWVQLLAVPAASKEDAESICQSLGSEGKALGCTVTPY